MRACANTQVLYMHSARPAEVDAGAAFLLSVSNAESQRVGLCVTEREKD